MSDFQVVAIKTEANLYEKIHEADELSTRCGEIYVGDNAKEWTFICTLCDESFHDIDEFMSHIRGSHIYIPPPPSVEPRPSDDISIEQYSLKSESPSFPLDNALINEFVDYKDFLDANVQDVPEDILSETSREIEVPASQDVKPETDVRSRHGSNSAISQEQWSNIEDVKAAREKNSPSKSCSPCPSVRQTKKVQGRNAQDRKHWFCRICKRKFKFPSHYRNHMVKHSTDRPFECAICQRGFKSKQSIRYHLKTHQRVPFKCEVCSLEFCFEFKLVSHMKTHKSKDTHPCKESKADKIIHMRTNSGDLPFACKHCSKRYRLRQHLGNHLRMHFTYRCERCRIQFHNGVPMRKPYRCPECYNKPDMEEILLENDEDSEVSDDEEKDITFHPVKYSERAILKPTRARLICKHCKKIYMTKRGLKRHISVKH